MKKLLFLSVIVSGLFFVFVSCDLNDMFQDKPIYDESKIDLSYIYPKDGNITSACTLSFYVDYQIKTTEPNWDGFYAHIWAAWDTTYEYISYKKKYLDDYTGLFPFNYIYEERDYNKMKGDTLYFKVEIYKYVNNTTKSIAESEHLKFIFK